MKKIHFDARENIKWVNKMKMRPKQEKKLEEEGNNGRENRCIHVFLLSVSADTF